MQLFHSLVKFLSSQVLFTDCPPPSPGGQRAVSSISTLGLRHSSLSLSTTQPCSQGRRGRKGCKELLCGGGWNGHQAHCPTWRPARAHKLEKKTWGHIYMQIFFAEDEPEEEEWTRGPRPAASTCYSAARVSIHVPRHQAAAMEQVQVVSIYFPLYPTKCHYKEALEEWLSIAIRRFPCCGKRSSIRNVRGLLTPIRSFGQNESVKVCHWRTF